MIGYITIWILAICFVIFIGLYRGADEFGLNDLKEASLNFIEMCVESKEAAEYLKLAALGTQNTNIINDVMSKVNTQNTNIINEVMSKVNTHNTNIINDVMSKVNRILTSSMKSCPR